MFRVELAGGGSLEQNVNILLQRTAACKFHPEHVVILQLTPVPASLLRTRGMRRGFYAHRIFYTARPRNRVSSSIGIGLEYL